MTGLGPTLLANASMLVGAMVLLWLVSLVRRDASIADPFWGTGFALVAWVSLGLAHRMGPRQLTVASLATVWGLRLSLHLLARNLASGEDPRYQAMRRHHGARFPWVSLGTVFLLQGALLWVVSLPLQVVGASPEAPGGVFDLVGLVLWGLGFAFEAVGDRQLARFRADPANRGQVMNRGLWRYTRHPNYFGDATLWWGLSCFAFAVGGYWTAIAPALMTFLLLRISGVTLLERGISERRPGYREYVETTSRFLPWPPKTSR